VDTKLIIRLLGQIDLHFRRGEYNHCYRVLRIAEREARDYAGVPARERDLTDIGLPERLANTLTGAGWRTVEAILAVEDARLLAVSGIGLKSLDELDNALAELGKTRKKRP
jgi:DNA-directed RNA polymerase alpha subunit